MYKPLQSTLSHNEIFSKIKPGDIIFTLKNTAFKVNKIDQLGVLIKKNNIIMVLLNTKTGFRLKPLTNFDTFVWFPVKSLFTYRSDNLIKPLLKESGKSYKNLFLFWFKERENNLKLLNIIRVLYVMLFEGFPGKLHPTTKNLYAYAVNNSILYFNIYPDFILNSSEHD